MRQAFYAALLLLAVSAASAGEDLQFLHGLGDTRYHHVESKGIGRGYHVYVMLPDGYEQAPDESYPTVYLLDGGALFPLLSAYYGYLNFGEDIPDAIIVGISYGSDSFEGGNYRSTDYTAPSAERDYWGGAEKFQQFLVDELTPLIETGYRSDADRRVIFGHSLGGQFVLYTALTRPQFFWGHIASNPALHRNLPFFMRKYEGSMSAAVDSGLFVASATKDEPRFRGPAMAWIEQWSGSVDKPWQLRTVDLEGHTHTSAAPAAFRQGMKWLFSVERKHSASSP